MSRLVKGIHHIALKCSSVEQYEEAVAFYHEILELPVVRSWGEGESAGIMIDTGSGLIEIFAQGQAQQETGSVNHFAFATNQPDMCVKAVREAGYKVTLESKELTINSIPAFPVRIAFVIGPVGEEIEFFEEK